MPRAYHMLISSLPQLPYFERAERLPITPLRLEQRLHMLDPNDAGQLAQARPLVGWRGMQWTHSSDADVMRQFADLRQGPLNWRLREYIDFRMDQLTTMAALRGRACGQDAPVVNEKWGLGGLTRRIALHWNTPDFGLGAQYRWAQEAAQFLQAGEATRLERTLMQAAWQKLSQLAERHPFGFEVVFAFVFKWDMLRAWLTHNPRAAAERFRQMVLEVTHDGHE